MVGGGRHFEYNAGRQGVAVGGDISLRDGRPLSVESSGRLFLMARYLYSRHLLEFQSQHSEVNKVKAALNSAARRPCLQRQRGLHLIQQLTSSSPT